MPAGVDPRTQTSTLWIKVDGSELPPAELGQIADLTIEQDLVLPDSFGIRIHDVDDRPGQAEQVHNRLLDQDRFPIGASIEIGLGREETPQAVLKGEITALDIDVRSDGIPLLTVRGYDGAHRLHRERKSRTFKNVSDSDLATQIARDYGLAPATDATPDVHEHVFQDNQTDWEFLRDRAQRVGFELTVRDGKLRFQRPAAGGSLPEQELGNTLHRVRMRLVAPSQVEEVVVKGWDPATKREIVGRATAPSNRPHIGESRSGSALAQRLGTGRYVLAEQPVRTQAEADALAQSLCDEIAGEFIQLEGTCLGETKLRPGHPLKLKNLGRRFDGEYYLSAVTHRITPSEGYLTEFVVSGRRPLTLSALLRSDSNARSGAAGRHGGVVVGLVTNNKDAERGGRVKVKFPWLADDESHWARLATPMTGDGRGFYFLPEVGDEVLVAFEHGDVNFPYVIGSVWNGRDKPPKDASVVVGPTGKVNQRIIKSRLGHTITLDDSDDSPSISIVDKSGQNRITLDSQSNKLTISVQGDVAIEAQSGVTVKGATVSIEATGALKINGATVESQAKGPHTIKGAVVNIN